MTIYRVSELEGALLDAAVAKANGDTLLPNFVMYQPHPTAQAEPCLRMDFDPEGPAHYFNHTTDFAMWLALRYSTEWDRGGPIIERERISMVAHPGRDVLMEWTAICEAARYRFDPIMVGQTPLIAAMRAYVASKFGETVDLP